jgi:putative DNA primase/helicase
MCQNNDFIYLYNGAFWSLVEDNELKMFLGISAEKMGVDQYKAKHFNFRDHLFKQFLALSNLKKPTKSTDTVQINLKNGTFEISPHGTKLRYFDSLDFLTYQLPFDYDPKATAPIFHRYLDKVLPDKQKQDILAEFLGYVFIQPSRLKLEKALLLHGKGANGKSVFYEIVRSLLGEENTSEYSLQSLTDDKGYHRAMLANKLVNYASEISGKLETAVFKQLVSGEPVEARLPYGRPLNITNYAKLIFNCNELPKDVEHTDAYFRRFLIIKFDVTIPEHEQDKELANKIISNELSGVFNWVLMGLERLLTQKNFTECAAVKEACNQYKLESNSVLLFLEENGYESCFQSYVLMKDLYLKYKDFCIEDGYKPVSKHNFRLRLLENKILVTKLNVGYAVYITNCYGGDK